MNQTTIVVVEDEEAIRRGIVEVLRASGFQIREAADGEKGLEQARRAGVDLVLLDLMLPKLDGMDVLRELRKTHKSLPVIILTARGMEDDRVAGLKAGADDYVVKPFSAKEMLARVEAVLRRSPARPSEVKALSIGGATVDFERREVRGPQERRQSLSETECSILMHLASNSGRAISREELLTLVWGISGAGVETRTIDMHVARLRSKLAEVGGEDQSYILTVRGKGYMLGQREE